MSAHEEAERPKHLIRLLVRSAVIVVLPGLQALLKPGAGVVEQLGAVRERVSGSLELIVNARDFFQLDLS